MKHTFLAALILTVLAGGVAMTGSDAEWTQLFNGKDTSGWTAFVPDLKDKDQMAVWSVSDGCLKCAGTPIGYIRTTEKFESFELELDWRFDPKKGPGNSGVLLRVIGDDQVWPNSIEAQLHSQNAGDIWNINEFPMKVATDRTRGRHTKKEHATNEKPLGEWNHYRIVLNGGSLQLWVNGLLQNDATDCKVVPGWIALQSEGAFIEFKDIRIKRLDATPSPAGR